jgi:hypothetical protein
MAKRHHRSKVRMGSLATGGFMGTAVPALVGSGLAIGSTLAIRAFVRPTSDMMAKVFRYAPFIGAAVGAVAAAPLGFAGASANQQVATAASAVAAGLGVFAVERLNSSVPGAELALAPAAPAAPTGTGTAGLRALTAEVRSAAQLRGVVMEPMNGLAGSYGDTVNASGMSGAFNPNAFGRPQSQVG